jgi:ectoine hydroxylase-related dioxygenase (phytanoyl-CoA dioxygenase family)
MMVMHEQIFFALGRQNHQSQMRSKTMSGLEVTGDYSPFIESDPSSDAEHLKSIMETYGYLFFRSLVSIQEILKVRRSIFKMLSRANLLDPTTDVMEGIAAPDVRSGIEERPEATGIYRDLLQLPEFHMLPSQPVFIDIARKLLGGDVTIHARRITRMTFPGSAKLATPPHQDYYYIRGPVETYTCWVPLGDCPRELGCLAVWPGSHRSGFLEHNVPASGAIGGHGVPVNESEAQWHTSDFYAGDALFFHSHTIHKALPNLTSHRIRLSTDNRYQRLQDSPYLQNLQGDMRLATVISAAGGESPITKSLAVFGSSEKMPDPEGVRSNDV